MADHCELDTRFDFRTDTPRGKDPDAHSPTLRRFHQLLWSKPLPNGDRFDLVATTPKIYLHHKSHLGEFWLASDAVVPSFTRAYKLREIVAQVPQKELDAFNALGYTMGGMMLWPGHRVGRKMTINGARGFHPRIKDRFDLTVECISRYYAGTPSPLSQILERYGDCFNLFGDFRGFVEFFLLHDIVNSDFTAVRFFTLFDDFQSSPLPQSIEEYVSYKVTAIAFIEARNRRMAAYWAAHGS